MLQDSELLKKEKLVVFIKKIINEIFSFSLILYLILFLLEEIKPNFVLNYLNLNSFLILVVVSGILTVLTKSDDINKLDKTEKKTKKIDYIFAFILGAIGGIVTYYKIKEIENWLSLVISLVIFILIFLIALLFLDKDEGKNN